MKIKGKFIVSILIFIVGILWTMQGNILAMPKDLVQPIAYTQEYQEWSKLSKEEKEKRLVPRMYEIKNEKVFTNNFLNLSRMLRSNVISSYNLVNIIPKNVTIKNQYNTNSCWAFASIGMIETSLALEDYYQGNTNHTYDFSERHMEYGTVRNLKNDAINPYGLNRTVGSGGNIYVAMAYLTNGMGAIPEDEMPFKDNMDQVELSEIQNKTISTQMIDTIDFATTSDVKEQIKQHISTSGGVYAGIHGASLTSDYYNIPTGALYCNDTQKCPMDHAVVIVGWDDEYSVDNFKEGIRPTNKGAWIVKNSWGTKMIVETVAQYKQEIFTKYQSECITNGWNTAEAIPNEFIQQILDQIGCRIEGENVILPVGKDGFMYISYEDVNIYQSLTGIIDADTNKNYDILYQHNEFGISNVLQALTNKAYLSNVFQKQSNKYEKLTNISVYAVEADSYRVFVNPNNDSKKKEDLQEVKLKNGNNQTLTAGYHTLQFAEPVQIVGNEFAIVVEMTAINGKNTVSYAVEQKQNGTSWSVVETNSNESFITDEAGFNTNIWNDMKAYGNLSIKAFSSYGAQSIKIKNVPTRVSYIEGENFEISGMKVVAVREDGTEEEIQDYQIQDGENLKQGQTSVTIIYDGKEVKQLITVKAKQIDNKEAVSSDLSKISAKITSAQVYLDTKNAKNDYLKFNIQVNHISASNNEKYEYYYYLSDSQAEKNIVDSQWMKVSKYEKDSDGTFILTIQANTKELGNYNKIKNASHLYLYIKEVVQNGNNQKTTIANATKIAYTITPETYVDGEKKQININNNNQSSSTGGNDDTIAKGTIPQAGVAITIVGIMVGIITITIISYYRYKNIDK